MSSAKPRKQFKKPTHPKRPKKSHMGRQIAQKVKQINKWPRK